MSCTRHDRGENTRCAAEFGRFASEAGQTNKTVDELSAIRAAERRTSRFKYTTEHFACKYISDRANLPKNTNENQILLCSRMIKSKYRLEAKQLLAKEEFRKDFNWLQSNLSVMAPSRHSLNQIFDILNANDENVDTDTRAHSFTFTNAWETPFASDLNSMKNLKTSLQTDVDRANLDHALQYFEASVNDFPGEYFLQSPYIFAVRNLNEIRW